MMVLGAVLDVLDVLRGVLRGILDLVENGVARFLYPAIRSLLKFMMNYQEGLATFNLEAGY